MSLDFLAGMSGKGAGETPVVKRRRGGEGGTPAGGCKADSRAEQRAAGHGSALHLPQCPPVSERGRRLPACLRKPDSFLHVPAEKIKA